MAVLNNARDILRPRTLDLGRPGQPLYVLRALLRVWQRRKLLLDLSVRSLRLQYTQTILGYGWVVLAPLAQLLVLNFIFAGVLDRGSDTHQYVLVLALGLFPWHIYATTLSAATESLVKARNLLSSIALPRDFLIISSVLAHVWDFVVVVLLTMALLIWTDHAPPLSAAWVPAILLAQLVFTIGLALPLAALNVFYHDVRFLLIVVLRVWFWMTPVFYTVEDVPERYRFLYDLNPMAQFVDAYRITLLSGKTPPLDNMAYVFLLPVVVLVIGYVAFSKMERSLVDRA